MPKDNLTFEEVNKLIEKADLASLEKASKKSASLAAAPAAAIPGQICAAYKVVRPILALIASTPFIPSKWKQAIKIFMSFMDAICP